MSVLATIEPTELQVEAGAEASLVVRVRNRGSIVDRFDIEVAGPTADWATVDPPSLRLFPDKEGEARVTFRPPRSPEPNADTYSFGVAVRAAADVDAVTVEEGHVTVGPFIQLTTEIVPQTSRGSRSGSHDVNIRNVGNAVAEVAVKASDPDRLLNFDVRPERVGLRPGATASIRTKVKPKDTFFLGSSKRVPFAVQVDEASGGSYPVGGTLEQRPLIPGWWKVVAGLAVAAIAGVVFLPSLLGGTAEATPTLVAVATDTPAPITAPPVTDAPPTEGPTPTPQLGPPDTLVAAGDKGDFGTSMISFVCPAKDACRDGIKDRILTILSTLQGKVSGAHLVSFTATPPGTLPITATWKSWHYPYSSSDGSHGDLTQVSIDLAPLLVGAPAYALVRDESGALFTFALNPDDADALFRSVYDGSVLDIALATPAPVASGPIILSGIYDTVYQGFLLNNIAFVLASPSP